MAPPFWLRRRVINVQRVLEDSLLANVPPLHEIRSLVRVRAATEVKLDQAVGDALSLPGDHGHVRGLECSGDAEVHREGQTARTGHPTQSVSSWSTDRVDPQHESCRDTRRLHRVCGLR